MEKRLGAALAVMILGVLLTGCQKSQTVQEDGRSGLLSAETETGSQNKTTAAETETEADSQSETTAAEPDSEARETPAAEPDDGLTDTFAATEEGNPSAVTETEAVTPETNADGVVILQFDEMYSSESSSRGMQFSDTFLAMDGKTVQISGYMAPPLKPVFNFFVLSKQPMAICPFCSSDADWPEDIVAIYVEEGEESVANDTLLTITGTLELGSYTDEDTGFVSQARIYADSIVHNR